MTTGPVHVYAERLADGEVLEPTLNSLLASLGGLESRVRAGDRVLIKPNFVAPFAKATTDLAVIDFFVRKVRELGAVPLLGESSGYEFDTRSTFEVLGVERFARERGLELIDFEQGEFVDVDLGPGLPTVPIAKVAVDAKLIINLPLLKGHTITRLTCAVKNLFGLLAKDGRRFLHSHALEPAIAGIARRMNHALHFVDARHQLERAVFAESRPLGWFLAAENPFALDHFGARLLGINPLAVKHLSDVPTYDVVGPEPESFPRPCKKNSLFQRFHRALYSAFYRVDDVKHRAIGGESILYDLHWYLGVHPALKPLTAEQARTVAASCPVGAIDADERTIRRTVCRTVRCLNCYREHPTLVELRGLNRPRKGLHG
jgi:uncharacterized protein (DUF362 family)